MIDETSIRLSVFRWIGERERWNNGIFSGRELNEGIVVDNRRITLKGQNGMMCHLPAESSGTARRRPYRPRFG